MAVKFSWAPYWQWQIRSWITHDVVAMLCKMMLLIGNVVKSYTEHDKMRIFQVQLLAVVGLIEQVATLWLIWSKQGTYLRYRRALLQLQWITIATMVNVSLPLLAAANSTQAGGVQRFISLFFRLSGFLNVMMAAMHRMSWQTVSVFCAAYGAWAVLTWTEPYCSYLLNDPTAGIENRQLLAAIASALDYITGHGDILQKGGSSVWRPYAYIISAACADRNSSSLVNASQTFPQASPELQSNSNAACNAGSTCPARLSYGIGSLLSSSSSSNSNNMAHHTGQLSVLCEQLQQGQCIAVTGTCMMGLAVFALVAVVLFFERYNKWVFLHTQAPWLLDDTSLPAAYAEKSRGVFMTQQLLHLHVLLDVPVFVLWIGFSAWSRPAAGVQELMRPDVWQP